MGIICSILILLLTGLSYDLNRKAKIGNGLSLSTEFLFFWFIIVSGGCLHLYGLYDISIYVYLLVVLGLISFFIGYRALIIPPQLVFNNKLNSKIEVLRLSIVFYILLALAVIITIKQIVLILPIILAQGMSEARGEFQLDDSLVLSGGMQILLFYFAKPFIKAAIIVFIINSIRTKFTLKTIIIILTLTLLYFLSEGGRAIVMDVGFILCYVVYANRKKITKKSRKRIIRLIVCIALIVIGATIERGSDIWKTLYTYYCGSLQFFSQAIDLKEDLFEDYLGGLACFQGFIKPFTGVFQIIGFEKPEIIENASDFILSAQNTVYYIGPDIRMNYFFTTFGYAYKDIGIFGVVIIHLIFGFLCRGVDYQQKRNNGSVRWLAIKTVFVYTILYTMSYFPFAMYLHAMTLIYIYLITTKIFSKKKYVDQSI